MKEEFQFVDTLKTEFDTGNPRIKKALEKYGDKITAERIHFALRSASDESSATSSFSKLRDSIRANGGVTQPITVVIQDDCSTCIDGNTRLAIYQDFLREETDGTWDQIPALVIKDAIQKDIETIRVSAHLIGARPWPAYEKARYLHYLYHKKLMDYGEMVALCGGNKPDIERQIEAYEDMNAYYRDLVDDTAFHIDRFSGFVELQANGIKDAIFEAGFDLKDFGEWIRDGKIRRLKDVRHLRKVLQDEEATRIFVEGGVRSIEHAKKHIDHVVLLDTTSDSGKLTLEKAPTDLLVQTLTLKIGEMQLDELKELKDQSSAEAVETVRLFEDLADRLNELLAYVGK